MNTREYVEYERKFFKRLEKYKNPHPATTAEIEKKISLFRRIGRPVLVRAADLMHTELMKRSGALDEIMNENSGDKR